MKNKKIYLFAAIVSIFSALFLSACSQPEKSDDSKIKKYTITFDANGGKFGGGEELITLTSDTPRAIGMDFPDPPPVFNDNFTFTRYYTEKIYGYLVTAETEFKPASQNFTVYARWQKTNLTGNDAQSVNKDRDNLKIDTYMDYFYHEILLPSRGEEGSDIKWTSSNSSYSVSANRIKIRDNSDFTGTVTLTAELSKGSSNAVKNFNITVRDKKFYGYLMVYFTGNSIAEEQVRYALGSDGRNFTALNSNKSVILSSEIADTGCVRDPYILRGADGNFYMTLTDMRSSSGWSSNRGIVLLKSADLINWTHGRVNISTKYPANFSDILSAWAPEVVYDRLENKYMVMFSSYRNGAPHNIYYSYANEIFTDLIQEPKQLYFHPQGNSAIDGDIVYLNGKYHLFYKNEGAGNRIARAESASLTSGWQLVNSNVDGESADVEGCQAYRLFGTSDFMLIYDRYNMSPPQFGYRTSSDFNTWSASGTMVTNGFSPRHGHVIPVTEEEYNRLNDYRQWPGALETPSVTEDAPLKLHYTFGSGDTASAIADASGCGNTGILQGGASLGTQGAYGYFNTGTGSGYLDMGSQAGAIITAQEDYTIASYVFIDNGASLSGNGWFLWCLANTVSAGSNSGNYVFFRSIAARNCHGLGGYSNESNVSLGYTFPKGKWQHIMYRQRGNMGTIYIDGKDAETGQMTIKTTNLGSLTYNYIGRPCYSGDSYMQRTRYADFRIYGGAVSESQIQAMNITAALAALNG